MSRIRPGRLGALPALLALAALFGGGLAGALKQSLEAPLGSPSRTPTTAAWGTVLSDPEFGEALVLSLEIALAAALLSALVALLLFSRLRRRPTALRALASAPVPVPHLLIAVVALTWLAPGGIAERLLGALPLNPVHDRAGLGVVLVYVYKEAPFLLLMLLASAGPSLAEREEAAAVLGVSPVQRVRWVTVPALRAPLAAGTLIVAAFALGSFEVPLVIGPDYPPTLATYAYQATLDNPIAGQGRAAVALLIAAAAAIAIAVGVLMLQRDTHA